jgi:predicted nucleic acid-binding protein
VTPYFLDTCVVLSLLRGNELGERLDTRFGLRDRADRHLISIVTHGELRAIAEQNKWGEKKLAALETSLQNLVTVDINQRAVIDAYVAVDHVRYNFPSGSRSIGQNDLWIAASTLAAGSVLITTDKDFVPLAPGLFELAYVDPDERGSSDEDG